MLFVVVAGISLAFALIWLGLKLQQAIPALNRPVQIASKKTAIKTMLSLSQVRATDRVIDVGCGKGDILFALAQRQIRSCGVEISARLVRYVRKKSQQLGVEQLVSVEQKSFWDVDYSQFDVVFVYTSAATMERLEKKLRSELPVGARVISNTFSFPNWKASRREGNIRVYVQEKK